MSEPTATGQGRAPSSDDVKQMFWAMIVIGIALVAIAVAVPGIQYAVIVLGAAAVAWATFGLLTEE